MTSEPQPAVSGHADPDDESPWAMQLVVFDDRANPPTHLAACEAAARAVVTLIADSRTIDGPWGESVERWQQGRIRKLVRRARGVKWDATAALDHVEVAHRGALVRAFVPGPTDAVPAQLSKLQVSGTDLPDLGTPGPTCPGALTIALNPRVQLSTGKAAAQCGHAAQVAYLKMPAAQQSGWSTIRHRVRVLTLTEQEWDARAATAPVSIVDAGFTEIAPGTQTTIAWWDPVDETLSDGTAACSAVTDDGARCRKPVPAGWHVYEGHGGGHFYASDSTAAILDGGHYDARKALGSGVIDGHLPADCPGDDACPWLRHRL